MNSDDTKRIIKKIAREEGLSERAVRMIVMSQFEGTKKIMSSAIPDRPDTFRNIVINAFGAFNVIPSRLKKFKNEKEFILLKRKEYDDKRRKQDIRNRKRKSND